MKINNYTIFNSTDTENWNKLRDSDDFQSFYIPKTKQSYLKNFENYSPDNIVISEIEEIIKKQKIKRLISFCSGTCFLELTLKNKFKLPVIVSDYTDSINRINEFLIFNEAIKIDIKEKIKFNFKKTDLIILSRIDTEFTDFDLVSIFKNLYINGAKNIYFIPAEKLTFKTILVKIKIILKCIFNFRIPVRWGYIRSNNHFLNIFNTHFSCKNFIKGYFIYSNEN